MTEHAGRENGQGGKTRPANRRVAQWMRDYARLPGTPDEYIAEDGAPRAVWSRFFDAFGALPPDEVERRFAMADRHLHEAGVTYRAPGDSADRRDEPDVGPRRGAGAEAESDGTDRDYHGSAERSGQERRAGRQDERGGQPV